MNENDNIIIQEGIYTAYYNEEIGMPIIMKK